MIQGQLWKIHFVIHDVPWQLYTIRFIDTAMASFHWILQWKEQRSTMISPGIIHHIYIRNIKPADDDSSWRDSCAIVLKWDSDEVDCKDEEIKK